MGSILVKTSGQTLTVTSITLVGGAAVTSYTTAALTTPITLPSTVSVDTTFYVAGTGQYTVTVTDAAGGVAFAGDLNVPGVLTPLPASLAQVEADLYRATTSRSVNVKNFGAVGNNTGDDYAGIAAAIAACPAGGVVFFPAGQYRSTKTIVVPANITLEGAFGYRYQQYTGTPTYIKPVFGNFTGNALIQCTDEADGWQLRNLALIGVGATNLSAGNIHGISSTGYVKGVKLQDVLIYNFTGDGVHTDTSATGQPGGWEVHGLYSSTNNGRGWYSQDSAGVGIAFTDSKIIQSECSANASDGWRFDGSPTNEMIGCWACFNAGHGYYLTVKANNHRFTACQTDRNSKNGWYVQITETAATAAPAPRVVALTGCIANRDGCNDDITPAGYAGLRVEGTSAGSPSCGVQLDGFQTHVNRNDSNAGIRCPDYGIYATNASTILMAGGFIQATVASTFDDNEAINDIGNVNHSTVNASTGVVTNIGLQGGLPVARPADGGYKAWNYDPITASGSTAPTAGVIYLQRVDLRTAKNITKVVYGFPSTAGMSLTSSQCFVGLYDFTGARVAVSADISGSVTSNEIAFSLTGTVTLTPGSYWAALLLNGTTMPTVARASGQLSGQGQSQITASKARFGSILTGQTTLPSSITPGSIAKISTGQNYWVALV